MEKLYIVTGAAGHLAGTILRLLSKTGCRARGLILPGESPDALAGVEYIEGDITRPESLDPLFRNNDGADVTVIHAAGLISISNYITPKLHEVNVTGTENIIYKCLEHDVKRLVYVSSVHAIPDAPNGGTIREISDFSPESVSGAYAKTKAEATLRVQQAADAGLDAVIVHPSGIIGPYDEGRNHMVQLIAAYVRGKIPAGVSGGYDFVDVRDVARGCILAAEKGKCGESYILSNRYCSIKDLFGYIRLTSGGLRKPCLPMWMAKAAAPIAELIGRLFHRRPLFTRYALQALTGNSIFSHDKATAELGFRPRDLKDTVADTVFWLKRKRFLPSGPDYTELQ